VKAGQPIHAGGLLSLSGKLKLDGLAKLSTAGLSGSRVRCLREHRRTGGSNFSGMKKARQSPKLNSAGELEYGQT
jgi:hypothetical protein